LRINTEKGTGTNKKLAENSAWQKVLDKVLKSEKTEQKTNVSQKATKVTSDFKLDPQELLTKATSGNTVGDLKEFCEKHKIQNLKYEEACHSNKIYIFFNLLFLKA